jgi:hypothetical protein
MEIEGIEKFAEHSKREMDFQRMETYTLRAEEVMVDKKERRKQTSKRTQTTKASRINHIPYSTKLGKSSQL